MSRVLYQLSYRSMMLSGKAESGGKSHLTQWSPLYIRLCGGKGSAISQRKGQRNQQSQACLRYFFRQKAEVQGAWKRSLERLPLRTDMAEVAGLEPADAGVKVPCLRPLGYTPRKNGGLGESRTRDACLRRASLYPSELRNQNGAGGGNRTRFSSLGS